MIIHNEILKILKNKGVITAGEVSRRFGISRQAATRHLKQLVLEKNLLRIGTTKGSRYVAFDSKLATKASIGRRFSSTYTTKNLEEHSVFREVELKMGLRKQLAEQAYRIAAFAFTEMLNNAIEHASSRNVAVTVKTDQENFSFFIRDYGIGVFENICHSFKLKSHLQAVEHLLKGKQTTVPKYHTGQGIFFTSKIADWFVLASSTLELIIDNAVEDIYLKNIKRFKGTRVGFAIKRRSRKDLRSVFDEYSSDDFEFDKTKIIVALSAGETDHVSRSQARVLLFGLDKFKRIVLDFRKVTGIGQGFADEIFRVFLLHHPTCEISTTNTTPAIDFMIARSKSLGPNSF